MAVSNAQYRAVECDTLTWLLIGDIREMLSEQLDDEAIRWLRPLIDALIRLMSEQAELEESTGWFSDMIEQFPHWSPRVERVQAELTMLCRSLSTLQDRIDWDVPFQNLAAEIEVELGLWINRMMRHHRDRHSLTQDVWYTEFGGEG